MATQPRSDFSGIQPLAVVTQTIETVETRSLKPEIMYRCGCRVLDTTPRQLILWCGQPDCLRLFEAGIAYDARQFQWQLANGGTPTMVAGLARYMRTPLAQTIPPPVEPLDPAGTIPFGAVLYGAPPDESVDPTLHIDSTYVPLGASPQPSAAPQAQGAKSMPGYNQPQQQQGPQQQQQGQQQQGQQSQGSQGGSGSGSSQEVQQAFEAGFKMAEEAILKGFELAKQSQSGGDQSSQGGQQSQGQGQGQQQQGGQQGGQQQGGWGSR